jgi:hypothetical protein
MNEKRTASLTPRQLRAIPTLLLSRNIEDGCSRAGISKGAYYKWLKNPGFVEAMKEERNRLVSDELDRLQQSIGKAVDALIGLLDSPNESIRRYTATDVLNFVLKAKELGALEERLTAIERIVLERKTYR